MLTHITFRLATGNEQIFELASNIVTGGFGRSLSAQGQGRIGAAEGEQQGTNDHVGVELQNGLDLERGLGNRPGHAEIAVDCQRQRLGGHGKAVDADEGDRADTALQRHPLARFVGTVAHQREGEIGVFEVEAHGVRRAAIDAGKSRYRLCADGQQINLDLVAIGQQHVGD